MLKGLENFHKALTELYEYKPIPKKLYRPLLWLLDILALVSFLFLFNTSRDNFLSVTALLLVTGLGYFVVITRTRR